MKIKIKTKNLNQPICSKNNNEYVGTGFMPTRNKGITLVALIITIIILLILAVVTIAAINKSNIIEKTKTSKEEYSIGEEKEKVTLAVQEANLEGQGTINEENVTNGMNTYFTSAGWTTQSNSKTTMTVQITESERLYKIYFGSGKIKNITIPENLKKYILGANKTGKSIDDLIKEQNNEIIFVSDESCQINEGDVKYLSLYYTGDNSVDCYIKYNNVAYKVILDSDLNTCKLEWMYEKEGREGEVLTGNYDGWTILYDNGDTVEAISPNAMGTDELNFNTSTVDEQIKSYNEAITTINKACQDLPDLPKNYGIRSVGASSEKMAEGEEYMFNKDWFNAYNGKLKQGKDCYSEDIARMLYFGLTNKTESFWIATKCITNPTYIIGEKNVEYIIGNVGFYSEGFMGTSNLWSVNDGGVIAGYGQIGYNVRPIITIKSEDI